MKNELESLKFDIECLKSEIRTAEDSLKILEDKISRLEKGSEESPKRASKREAALAEENAKLKELLDSALSDMESIKAEALKAQEVIHTLMETKEDLEHALEELKKKVVEKPREKVVLGKYRQPVEKRFYEPKRGFRIKEN